MPRESPKDRWNRWIAVLVAAFVLSSGGCAAVATAIYVAKGTNAEAEFNGLRGKRVVVVCRPAAALQYNHSNVARDLADQVGLLLKKNIIRKKIELIDQEEVERWTDENAWDEYTELGEALDAEMVLAVDLEAFSIYQGQTLFQGRANVSVTVVDMETRDTVFEKTLPETVYPPNIGIPTSEKQEAEFRRQFVGELAEEIARHFYAHDTRVDFAKDAKAFQ